VCEAEDWIKLAQHKFQQLPLVNIVMDLRIPCKVRNVLTGSEKFGFVDLVQNILLLPSKYMLLAKLVIKFAKIKPLISLHFSVYVPILKNRVGPCCCQATAR
jgi:hypothetical protein